ncbi:ATP-dependent exoDNAse (exonuclease V) beta subunit [Sediminihabitans luteus]|uniref:DNA 3'-5' helicase n=1 Tax=Sediminihabitans luteus TaxID=1138585 RepID=A0A2M9CPM7_9CELL|nr:UvrD-helicase domain-containing protein [Sediminihabitans luteus]PJJ73851.1 ATP-dependent exoDNAse (exonuclease V) beta subunit [Sediminihabitans luteus]GII98239.1 ATP-dependent DNA helicase [Sediminihabitans luteus]
MTATPPVVVDQDARELIADATDRTLFVNAGAGSGKTTALVQRVRTLVLRDGVRLRNVAAVTFTEKAGAELRDRLRGSFEDARRHADTTNVAGDRLRAWAGVDAIELRRRADEALDDLDGAAIGTLHSFAQRILTEHAIAAGLPPLLEGMDEVGSSVAFEEQWSAMLVALLDDDEIAPALLLALGGGVQLKDVRALAKALGSDWDLIDERVLVGEAEPVVRPVVDGVVREARAVLALREHCTEPGDTMLPKLAELEGALGVLEAAVDDAGRLLALHRVGELKFGNKGRAANWDVPVSEVRNAGRSAAEAATAESKRVVDRALRLLTRWTARAVLDAAEDRRREGRLEFHDLLVLSRRLLRREPEVRAALHDRYTHLLLDEFQDTDPIQIELAARIAGGAGATAERWQDVDVPAGRLFVVGDAKQSIYRFRRANVATYLAAQQTLGERVSLTTNFRTVPPVLDWVNAVFGRVIVEEHERQPEYEPLAYHRRELGGTVSGTTAPGAPGVVVLGAAAHEDRPTATVLREREADDVAGVVAKALVEGWQVQDRSASGGDCWRALQARDVAVLVPARTSLPQLENALRRAGVPYRAEASSLVYEAAEVRDLLACARAVADTSDELSLVTALRSPLFGCGDDDLWRWKHAGGRFTVFSTLEGTTAPGVADGPVAAALVWLRSLYFDSRWATPSELLGRIVDERRMLEVAALDARSRDVWRRLRFVVDQARAWGEVSHGGLRAYLAWAAHQGTETGRVAESVLPETDVEAVRVMTVHAAKGLEFPFVVLSGMTSRGGGRRGLKLLWPPEGGYSVRLRAGVETDDFALAQPVDEQMDDLEKRRLLYVAATRARDHLVVSLHRVEGSKTESAAKLLADVGGAGNLGEERFAASSDGASGAVAASGEGDVAPLPPYDDWLAGVTAARTRSERDAAISASGLEGTEPAVVLAEPDDIAQGQAKGARDLELPPWSKGRYGSAIGRAVHGVLQAVDLATGDGVDEAVAAQAVAEGVVGAEELVTGLVRSAVASELVQRAATREHWRETYVGTVDDDGTVLEGYVDLVFRDDDGSLVVVDYKTDAVPAGAYSSRLEYYAPQLRAYARCLGDATGAMVRAELLFLHPQRAVPIAVPPST